MSLCSQQNTASLYREIHIQYFLDKEETHQTMASHYWSGPLLIAKWPQGSTGHVSFTTLNILPLVEWHQQGKDVWQRKNKVWVKEVSPAHQQPFAQSLQHQDNADEAFKSVHLHLSPDVGAGDLDVGGVPLLGKPVLPVHLPTWVPLTHKGWWPSLRMSDWI